MSAKNLSLSRRSFLAASAGLASSAVPRTRLATASPLGANDRVRVGVIGTGVRGRYLIGNLPGSARVEAVCDCATSRLADTLEPKQEFREILAGFQQKDARHCSTYQDYRRMIDQEDLDAVIIATPDHHHVQAAMLALQAGLDVYLEKPLTVTIGEGRTLVDMVKTTGRILQVGSQQRTMEVNRFACEFIRDGGLGKISSVDFPNYPGPLRDPQLAREPVPEGFEWELFLGPTRWRPHNRKLWAKDVFKVDDLMWRGWDLYREYSGHLMTNWGAHSMDMVQYALGMDHSGPVKIAPLKVFDDPEIDRMPTERAPGAPALGGSGETETSGADTRVSAADLERDWQVKWSKKTPRPAESWTTAARFQPVALQYASGVRVNMLPGIPGTTLYGDKGRMTIGRNRFQCFPNSLVRYEPDPKVLANWHGRGFVARPHLENWLECVRSRETPNAPVEVGHRTATVCHLVNLARELNRELAWDPSQEQFVQDAEANQQLNRERRDGFQLPVP